MLLLSVPVIILTLLPAIAPVSDGVLVVGVPQLYSVFTGTIPLVISVGLMVNCTPLQVTVDMALICGLGLIYTVKVNALLLGQLASDGITV